MYNSEVYQSASQMPALQPRDQKSKLN